MRAPAYTYAFASPLKTLCTLLSALLFHSTLARITGAYAVLPYNSTAGVLCYRNTRTSVEMPFIQVILIFMKILSSYKRVTILQQCV